MKSPVRNHLMTREKGFLHTVISLRLLIGSFFTNELCIVNALTRVTRNGREARGGAARRPPAGTGRGGGEGMRALEQEEREQWPRMCEECRQHSDSDAADHYTRPTK